MDDDALSDLGLSKNEAKVYLTLLKLGESTGPQIADKSKVHRTNVYDALERLIEKGLVSYILKDKVKYFEATDPGNLMKLLDEKKDNLQRLLPTLLLEKKLTGDTQVKVSEGIIAARHQFLSFLDIGKEILVFGVPKEAPELLGDFYLQRFHRTRIEKKIEERVIYCSDAMERVSKLQKIKMLKYRILPPQFNSPMSINICGDEVFFAVYSRDPCLIISIHGKDIADIFRQYFEVMWQVSKQP
jgi:HTH-type transcriptional regulator, sugar sensing transcriptional regulator